MRHRALPIVALFAFASCQVTGHDPAPTSQTSSLVAAIQAAQARMHARFGAARRLEEAIARSDLDRAHAEAHLLGQLDEPDALPIWRPYVDEIRGAAHQIELAGDVITAARLAGTLGQRCAQCHTALAVHIAFPVEPRPADDPNRGPRMPSHQWAAARMWEGLIGPSDERWATGARALTTVALTMVAQSVTPSSELDVDEVARIRLYATRALATGPIDARADVFGGLLAACARCHAELRDR
jgi:mono/diheme cytochrome c family protein